MYFYRKAQALAAQLYLRFRGEDPRFDFGDVAALSVDSGARGSAVCACSSLPWLCNTAVVRMRLCLLHSPVTAACPFAARAGNVLPAVLRQAGVLRYSADMAAVVDAGEDLGGDPKEPVLRAAAVEAGACVCASMCAARGTALRCWGETEGHACCLALLLEAGPPLSRETEPLLSLRESHRHRRSRLPPAGQRICEAAGGAFHPYQLSLHLLHQAQTRPEYQQLKKHVARGTVAY